MQVQQMRGFSQWYGSGVFWFIDSAMSSVVVVVSPIQTNVFNTFSVVWAVRVRGIVGTVSTDFQGVNCWFTTRTVKCFLTVGALEHNKAIVRFQSFELVGWRVFSAGVSKDSSKPSTLFFDGEEIVSHGLVRSAWVITATAALTVQPMMHTNP